MKPPDYQGPIRLSGLRILFEPPNVQPYRWEALRKTVEPYAPLIQALREEPYYVDDGYRALPHLTAVMGSLQSGELFLAIYKEQIVASIFLTSIRADRDAYFEGWIHPNARKTYLGRKIALFFAKEVINYCFKPWSNGNSDTDGLGLRKVKAKIASDNYPSLRAATVLGFRQTGLSPLDALHHGKLYDNVEMELLNPAFFRPALENINVKTTERSRIQPASSGGAEPGVHTSGPSSIDTGSDDSDTAATEFRPDQLGGTVSPEPSADNAGGSSSGESTAELASAFERGEPVEPGWDIPVPTELRTTEHSPADATANLITRK